MLAGIKFVDRSEVDRALEEERKTLRKQKKKEKKERKRGKHKEKSSALPGGKSDGEPAGPLHEQNLETAAAEASATAAQAASSPSAPAATAGPATEREDWMTKSFPKASASADAVPLPGAKPDEKMVKPKAAAPDPQEGLVRLDGHSSGKAGSSRVGDGGASWRLKALARAKNQATDASDPNFGRRVGDIVSEQWGSLAELTAGLTDTRAAHAKAHLLAAKERQAAAAQSEDANPASAKGGSDRQDRGDAAHYLQGVKSSKAQMRRPTQTGSLSWRRGTSGTTSRQPSAADRDRANSPTAKDNARRDSSAEPRDAEEDRDTDRSVRGTGHADRHTREKISASNGDRLGNRHGDRHAEDRFNSHRQEEAEHGEHDRQQHRWEQRRPPPKRPVVNPNSKQAELLASVASDMNTFSNDGTFMDRFSALQASGGGANKQTGRPTPEEEEEELSLSSLSDDESGEQQRPRGAAGANQGAAAVLRAKLQGGATQSAPAGDGNKATAAALRARLMQGKQPSMVVGPNPDSAQNSAQGSAAATESRAQSVQLSAIDSMGRAVPGAFGRAAVGAGASEGGRKPKRVQRFDAGERQRYFADDDKQHLGDLVAQQRYEGAVDIDANLADNIVRKGKRFREKELDVDEEYDLDGGLDMYESRKIKGTKEQQVKRDRAAQIADHRRISNAVDRCPLCIASTSRPRHLTISLGQTAYLALPARGRLGEGHSIIVPTEHVASTRQVDEHIWTELRNFKKCLLQMHMAQGMDVVFMETAMRLGDARTHAVVHCIPVQPNITAKAPLYFKKGIDDAESEWSQHHAKRMIETGGKGLRGSIPANFPYFHVEFNLTRGFVHVIDDEAKFDPQFGRSIMIGLLDLPTEDMHR
ncbi:TPA: hypothetical protein ACH3X1_006813 [Trebouxia sp. C0004]